MGGARRLVGLLAHPLNRAVFDPTTGRVIAGYTIVQPRIETSPSRPRQTLFSRIFAGDVGFDIYTHACSEIYQDLFGAGIYVGKGIYDVDAFMRSVEGRVPENALVSHDLFEGIHGRAALATDIVLFEGYPENYATYAMRMHRWLRGDWQLLPWLLAKVPSERGERLWNKLSFIDRWKIADNLRRSLVAPFTLALFWCSAGSGSRAAPSSGRSRRSRSCSRAVAGARHRRRRRAETLARSGLAVVLLAYEAILVVDAIVRVGVRQTVTRKHLLQWISAAHSAFGFAARRRARCSGDDGAVAAARARDRGAPRVARADRARRGGAAAHPLAPGPRGGAVDEPTGAGTRRADHRSTSARSCASWHAAPGASSTSSSGQTISGSPSTTTRRSPTSRPPTARRPTNIGLTLVATLSAYDFGYIGPSELSLRVRRAFDSITRMTHYQGHLFNWYDTKNLQPLLPRYVSTVDSGNFAGCLLALKHGCRDLVTAPVVRAQDWDGLRDSIDLLEEAVRSAPSAATDALRQVIARMQRATDRARDHLDDAYGTLRTLCDDTAPELDRELLAFLETGVHRHEADLLHALRTSIDRLHQHLRQMRRELDALLPWLALGADATAVGLTLPTTLRLEEIPAASARLRAELAAKTTARGSLGASAADLALATERLDAALASGAMNAEALIGEFQALAVRADDEVREMDFKLLYDGERKLFHIGYNATGDQLDLNYYDLLASEARLASYLAIVKRDVPASHWYALRRPLTRLNGAAALLSWGGTMFEYLMPGLLMKSQDGTLLARTQRGSSWTRRSPTPSGTGAAVGHLRVGVRAGRQRADLSVSILRGPRPRLQARARGGSGHQPLRVAPRGRDPTARGRRQPGRARSDGDAGHVRPVRGARSDADAHAVGRGESSPDGDRALLHGAPPGDAPRRARQRAERTLDGRSVSRRCPGRDRRGAPQRAPARRGRPPSGPSRKTRRSSTATRTRSSPRAPRRRGWRRLMRVRRRSC
jgi:cyclic beta-1,2-glucan synthetase